MSFAAFGKIAIGVAKKAAPTILSSTKKLVPVVGKLSTNLAQKFGMAVKTPVGRELSTTVLSVGTTVASASLLGLSKEEAKTAVAFKLSPVLTVGKTVKDLIYAPKKQETVQKNLATNIIPAVVGGAGALVGGYTIWDALKDVPKKKQTVTQKIEAVEPVVEKIRPQPQPKEKKKEEPIVSPAPVPAAPEVLPSTIKKKKKTKKKAKPKKKKKKAKPRKKAKPKKKAKSKKKAKKKRRK
jgi:hypothetical protein